MKLDNTYLHVLFPFYYKRHVYFACCAFGEIVQLEYLIGKYLLSSLIGLIQTAFLNDCLKTLSTDCFPGRQASYFYQLESFSLHSIALDDIC